MSNKGDPWSGRSRGPEWPEYLEPLRPDEVTQRRIRRHVRAATEALELRARTWFDVTASWSSILAPLAAGLLVVFGTLAYRTAEPAAETVAVEDGTEQTEFVLSLAPDVEAPPPLLIDLAEPSRDAVLAAALISR